MARAQAPVAIVTGAARGIGRAIAHHLLDGGWHIGAVDLPQAGLKRSYNRYGRNVVLIEGDVADEETARRAVKAVTEKFNRLDALVSNAGVMVRKPLRQLTLGEWRKVLDTNLTATFLFARAAERPLRAAGGAIVTIASTRALMSEPNTESYSASKGGLLALTHALAISLGPDVRVNCVSPGWIVTKPGEKLRRKDHQQHPVGRAGWPQDIAEMVAFLLDGKRAGFITGTNVVVDGGMTRKMIYEE
ncbi:MAG TPA: SDR family oxidoreductase [Xanthobacteraceae bacterium]|nr:SDR family oxidoreductase [Xanthobacteraceae bacterium]